MIEKNYIREVFSLLLERSQAARGRAHDETSGAEDRAFAAGLRQGYYESLSVMLGQLDAFGIERISVGVPADLAPERDLL